MRAYEPTNHSASAARCASPDDWALLFRIRAEFTEMPGLTLTLPQAARLFHLDARQCERILESLVDAGQLAIKGKMFVRR